MVKKAYIKNLREYHTLGNKLKTKKEMLSGKSITKEMRSIEEV